MFYSFHGRRYTVPGRRWFHAVGIPAAYDATKAHIQDALKDTVPAMTCDGWKTFAGFKLWVTTAR